MQNRNSTLQQYIQLKQNTSTKRLDNEAAFNERIALAEKLKQIFFTFCEEQNHELALNCIDDALGCLGPVMLHKTSHSFPAALKLSFELCNNAYQFLISHKHQFTEKAYNKALNKELLRMENLAKMNPNTPATSNHLKKLQSSAKIQAFIRGNNDREKYSIDSLPLNMLDDYPLFVIGNDPEIPLESKHSEPDDKIALVATSGMRAISLACKLGNMKNIPKILLVDNSTQSHVFWGELKNLINNDNTAGNEDLFFKSLLPVLLSQTRKHYRDLPANALTMYNTESVKYLNQDIPAYFKSLFQQFGYDYVRRVISHTSLIRQSWTDESTFIKIKNILAHLNINKIFMYPSNILDYTENERLANQLLENIKLLNPQLCIQTYEKYTIGKPDSVLLATDPNEIIKPQKETEYAFENDFSISDFIRLFSIFHHAQIAPVQEYDQNPKNSPL